MKKVNAVIGFTRIDEMERVNDLVSRLVKLTRDGRPTWVPATEDRGEGVFLQLDENAVASWEAKILRTALWASHREAHRRNFARRFSATAAQIDPDSRFPAPRYWLIHTFAHILIREMAMSCGYGAASLSERLYAWPASPDRPAAAGLLICTTASDSEGTLGGLVALSDPERLQGLVLNGFRRASRCSSDPVCAQRTPRDPEDFLHGAACHCCSFASETSCERANRFLDRRFLLNLPASNGDQCRASLALPMPTEPFAELGAFLTQFEAERLAASLANGDTTTQALKEVHVARRSEAKRLIALAGLGHQNVDTSTAVLRGIAGARSVRSAVNPVWTMPGAEATVGRLTSEAQRLIDDARMSVVCSSFNFTPHSAMWTALQAASARPDVTVTIYLDAAKGSPEAVANHMPKATVYRTLILDGDDRPLVSHAKFIIVDRAVTFLTSANFSYSAENTNVELGLLVHETALAASIESLMRGKHGVLYERVRPG